MSWSHMRHCQRYVFGEFLRLTRGGKGDMLIWWCILVLAIMDVLPNSLSIHTWRIFGGSRPRPSGDLRLNWVRTIPTASRPNVSELYARFHRADGWIRSEWVRWIVRVVSVCQRRRICEFSLSLSLSFTFAFEWRKKTVILTEEF